MKIGVLAGTPVDTRMGVDYVSRFGHETVWRACSASPEEQMLMQKLHPQELTEQVVRLCRELTDEGAEGIYVNCNSMTAAVDMPYVLKTTGIQKIVTPFSVYTECAKRHRRLAIIAANGQSLAAIEKVMAEAEPDCVTFGASMTPLVLAIEAQEPPEQIVQTCGIEGLLSSFQSMGCEALVLGCTHFPYVQENLRPFFQLPIIDPNRRMLELLTSGR